MSIIDHHADYYEDTLKVLYCTMCEALTVTAKNVHVLNKNRSVHLHITLMDQLLQ